MTSTATAAACTSRSRRRGKYWRLDYRHPGKRKTLALGVYPAVTLAQARKKREQARELLAQDIDPGATKQAEKVAKRTAAANTFEAIAREFHETKRSGWSGSYAEKWIGRMEKDLFPPLGRMALVDITAPLPLAQLRRVEKRGAKETAQTLRQTAGQVFRYGIQTGRCERNPVADLQGALEPLTVKHMAAVLEPVKAGELLRAIEGYTGQPITRAALQLSALLFQRPGNIRAMEWTWVDFDRSPADHPSPGDEAHDPRQGQRPPAFRAAGAPGRCRSAGTAATDRARPVRVPKPAHGRAAYQ